MIGYYDYVLGIIPLSLLGITAVLSIFGVPLTTAIPAGGGFAGLVVAHALFINGPATPTVPGLSVSDAAPAQTPPQR